MKKLILGFIIGLFLGCGMPVWAQPIPALFQPLNWEQASLVAARENKLILVQVGTVAPSIEKNFQKHRELMNYMLRNVVAIRMDMSTPAGKEFESRLLMYPYPAYAYFMPYGDLVGIITPDEVARKPEALREIFQTAREAADLKKRNSRSVAFADMELPLALKAAKDTDKNLFVYVYSRQDQASLLVERNVLNLDRVADFYNQNFINLRVSADQIQMHEYRLQGTPSFLYLTPNGKILFQATGYSDAEQLLQYGNTALEKAKGIPFEILSDDEAVKKALQLGKLIFTDYYMAGTTHKELVKQVFADPEVTDLFMQNFVNVGREGNRTMLVFSDASGKELHRILQVKDAAELLQEARRTIAGKGLFGMQQEYSDGNRQAEFMEEYIRMLGRAGQMEEASRITMEYLSPLSPECLKTARYWELFYRYTIHITPEFFEFVLEHRNELFALYGEEKVHKKITGLWIAGAEEFVKDGKFDEAGFKEYTRRLKKEKVEGWRLIVRNARMLAAEQVGDWKTFVTLAEEKWNEEKIPDAELYRWGIKVNDQCSDENVRYKMAQWLAQRAIAMEQKEQLTGRVKISSYKGFFEKLVNDLMKE